MKATFTKSLVRIVATAAIAGSLVAGAVPAQAKEHILLARQTQVPSVQAELNVTSPAASADGCTQTSKGGAAWKWHSCTFFGTNFQCFEAPGAGKVECFKDHVQP
jgi:hypothetical protein